MENGLTSDRFLLSPDLLTKLQDDKMWSWQNNVFQRSRFDFPLTNWVAGIQNALLTNLMNPTLQARVVEAAYTTNDPMTLGEVYGTLTKSIWTGNMTPSGRTAAMDRNLQRVYTGKLIQQVTMPRPGTPQDAIALSRQGLDDATNAHLMETVARIDRALDAKRMTMF